MNHSQRGVTLVELLITIIIGSIAFMALSVPFVAERANWQTGKAKTESQRDAQLALTAIARTARSGGFYQITGAAGSHTLTIYDKPGAGQTVIGCFQGGPGYTSQFQIGTACNALSAFIDGGRSRVQSFTVTPVTNRLVQTQLTVLHDPIVGSSRTQTETLNTQIYLRNAP